MYKVVIKAIKEASQILHLLTSHAKMPSMNVFTILIWFSILVSSRASDKYNTMTNGQVDLQGMQKQINKIEDITLAHHESFATQRRIISKLDKYLRFQNEMITQQNEAIHGLRKELKDLTDVIARLQCDTSEARYAFNEMGCLSDILSLSCPDNRTIKVTSAEYGQYEFSCTEACCAPNPQYDCTDDLATNFPEDWVYLKYLCDNQTSCNYEYKGRTIPECEAEYIADYVQILYDCLPGHNETVVGFTAWASQTRSYAIGETVLFDNIDSNFGGHYNAATSTFHCPYHATYMFSVNYLSYLNVHMAAQISLDDTILAYPFADAISGTYNHASALVITECSPGQLVWVRSGYTGEMFGDSHYSLFSGYLLQRLS